MFVKKTLVPDSIEGFANMINMARTSLPSSRALLNVLYIYIYIYIDELVHGGITWNKAKRLSSRLVYSLSK